MPWSVVDVDFQVFWGLVLNRRPHKDQLHVMGVVAFGLGSGCTGEKVTLTLLYVTFVLMSSVG